MGTLAASLEQGMACPLLGQVGWKSFQSWGWRLRWGQAWEDVSLELLTVAIPGCINASGVTLAFSRKGPAAKVVMQRQPHL